MKKKLAAVLIALCMITAVGCGGRDGADSAGNGVTDETGGNHQDEPADGTDSINDTAPDSGASTNGTDGIKPDSGDSLGGAEGGEQADVLTLRIVDGAQSGNLVLAGEGAGAVYTMSVGDTDIFLDGGAAMASVLEDGMLAEIRFTGGIMETFPAQIEDVVSISVYSRGTEQNPMGTYYDLCGLYLQVLNDLWDKDSGLNGGAVYVSVDFSEAPGELTQGEKEAVAWIFANEHGAEPLTLTYQELAEQGYLSEYGNVGLTDDGHKIYEWTDGVLFSITEKAWDENEVYSLPVLKFNAEKWRSPLGAYFFEDCKAVWAESGSWSSYSVGAEMIS